MPRPDEVYLLEDDGDYESEDDEDDEDDDDDEEEEEEVVGGMTLRSVLYGPPQPSVGTVEKKCGAKESHDGEGCEQEEEGQEEEAVCGEGLVDGLYCPICMEAWTTGGDHQVCCLPCGHLYGMSCIKKWLSQRRSMGKCPQCNRKTVLKDVRVLYASRIAVVDEELQKKIRYLEAKSTSLEKKNADYSKKEVQWRSKEADLLVELQRLKERAKHLEVLLKDKERKPSGWASEAQPACGINLKFMNDRQAQFDGFTLQKNMGVDGARLFDVDINDQMLVVARRLPGMGLRYALTKISLLSPHERENIQLPANLKAVKDLRVSSHGRLALLACLGKKLSVLSTESNNTVLTFDLPAAAWSCSWDLNDSQYLYAGLQNGMVLEFDKRQPAGPVESIMGLSTFPIHTIHSVSADASLTSGARPVLAASAVGLGEYNFGCGLDRPSPVAGSLNQGVCISLAYEPNSDDIVASFRPKVEIAGDIAVSQSMSSGFLGQGVQGSHVLYRRISNLYQQLGSVCANVNEIRLPKTAIIGRATQNPLFVSSDEATQGLVLQELPSLMFVRHVKPLRYPVHDVKYAPIMDSGLLGCLSDDTLQIFSPNLI